MIFILCLWGGLMTFALWNIGEMLNNLCSINHDIHNMKYQLSRIADAISRLNEE